MDRIHMHFQSPEICPYCGSAETYEQDVDVDQRQALQKVQCMACRRTWQDVYHLAAMIDDRNQTTALANLGPSEDAGATEN